MSALTENQPDMSVRAANHWMPVTASETALSILDKDVRFEKTALNQGPPQLASLYRDVSSLLPSSGSCCSLKPVDVVTRILSKALCAVYNDEQAFDDALFTAWMNCFTRPTPVVRSKGKSFIVHVFADNTAVGFCSQLTKDELGIPEGFGGSRDNRHDHSCVIFNRVRSVWQVKECTSSLELKMHDTICRAANVERRETRLEGGLGQAIVYSLVDVWSSLTRMGIPLNSDPVDNCLHIPITILAGKRKKTKSTPNVSTSQARYVRASLRIPRNCGALFSYSIEGFAPFSVTRETTAARRTLTSVYIESCLSGLRFAFAPRSYNPRPMSGLQLWSHDDKLTLIGSPVPRGTFLASPSFTAPTQADIWEGNLTTSDLDELLAPLEYRMVGSSFLGRFFSSYLQSEENQILVKVSTRAVHGQLMRPDKFQVALLRIQNHSKFGLLSYVLLGADIKPGNISIVVMRDLRAQGFTPLFPKRAGYRLSLLWEGLASSLVTTMIGLAKCGVVHRDIRAGFDETANVLVREVRKRRFMVSRSCYELVLVDLEGLSRFKDCGKIDDARYLQKKVGRVLLKSAMAFVWCQVFVIGYCWATKTNLNEVNVENIFRIMHPVRQDVDELQVTTLVGGIHEILLDLESEDARMHLDLHSRFQDLLI